MLGYHFHFSFSFFVLRNDITDNARQVTSKSLVISVAELCQSPPRLYLFSKRLLWRCFCDRVNEQSVEHFHVSIVARLEKVLIQCSLFRLLGSSCFFFFHRKHIKMVWRSIEHAMLSFPDGRRDTVRFRRTESFSFRSVSVIFLYQQSLDCGYLSRTSLHPLAVRDFIACLSNARCKRRPSIPSR